MPLAPPAPSHRRPLHVAAAALGAIALAASGCSDSRPTHQLGANAGPLSGKTIAILATDGFEQDELLKPRRALEEAGARTLVIAPQAGKIRAWDKTDWGTSVAVDETLAQARPDAYDALLLPGGVMNPDKLRMDPAAVAFTQGFVTAGKPIAAICHGPWLLVEAGGVKGKRMTSWPSLRTDLANAGATWVDEPAVRDGKLVTSRKPADIPAFDAQVIPLFAGR
jgi:protease I